MTAAATTKDVTVNCRTHSRSSAAADLPTPCGALRTRAPAHQFDSTTEEIQTENLSGPVSRDPQYSTSLPFPWPGATEGRQAQCSQHSALRSMLHRAGTRCSIFSLACARKELFKHRTSSCHDSCRPPSSFVGEIPDSSPAS